MTETELPAVEAAVGEVTVTESEARVEDCSGKKDRRVLDPFGSDESKERGVVDRGRKAATALADEMAVNAAKHSLVRNDMI